MIRRLAVLAVLFAGLSGCASFYPAYDEPVRYRDGGYYAPADDTYGDYYTAPAQVDYRYHYDPYASSFWRLDRFGCGYYGSCWPYYYGGYHRPYGNWSFWLGGAWGFGNWGHHHRHGHRHGGYAAWSDYGWSAPAPPRPRQQRQRPRFEPAQERPRQMLRPVEERPDKYRPRPIDSRPQAAVIEDREQYAPRPWGPAPERDAPAPRPPAPERYASSPRERDDGERRVVREARRERDSEDDSEP